MVINLPFGSDLILIKQPSTSRQGKCLFLLQPLSQGYSAALYRFSEKLLYQFSLQPYTESDFLSLAVALN